MKSIALARASIHHALTRQSHDTLARASMTHSQGHQEHRTGESINTCVRGWAPYNVALADVATCRTLYKRETLVFTQNTAMRQHNVALADVAPCRSVSSASPPLACIWFVADRQRRDGAQVSKKKSIVWNATVMFCNSCGHSCSALPRQLVLPRDWPGSCWVSAYSSEVTVPSYSPTSFCVASRYVKTKNRSLLPPG